LGDVIPSAVCGRSDEARRCLRSWDGGESGCENASAWCRCINFRFRRLFLRLGSACVSMPALKFESGVFRFDSKVGLPFASILVCGVCRGVVCVAADF
jgi:hypothetical protein